MTGYVVFCVAVMTCLIWGVVHYANGEQDKYDTCWVAGGVQVKTVKFSNGTVCIDRRYVIEP